MTEEKKTEIPEFAPNPVLEEIADRKEREAHHAVMADAGEQLSVKEKLLRRSRRQTYLLRIEDPEGDIEIEIRHMTSEERERAILEYQKVSEMGDDGLSVFSEAMKGLCEILDAIVVDPDLKGEFVKGGEWLTDDIIMWLVLKAIEVSFTAVGENLQRFRENTERSDSA